MTGLMWEFNHLRVLEWDEYEYWLLHALPFGWSIITPPKKIKGDLANADIDK